mmetsp:Transcript_75842/g.220238  ORF Transcript_75842/g.220238 Transcript_75842/m.220238 type:complete len:89 (+) Transcript_75842:373-639(+)
MNNAAIKIPFTNNGTEDNTWYSTTIFAPFKLLFEFLQFLLDQLLICRLIEGWSYHVPLLGVCGWEIGALKLVECVHESNIVKMRKLGS